MSTELHNATSPQKASFSSTRWQRSIVQALRVLIGCTGLWFLSKSIAFQTDYLLLAVSLAAGILFAMPLLKRGISLLNLILLHGAIAAAIHYGLLLANAAVLSSLNDSVTDFLIPLLGQHIWLCFGFYCLGLFSTWLFWRFEHALTCEGILGVGTVIWLLSAHRNYRLDAPKEVASLTWKIPQLQHWGIEPQHLILGIGILCILVFLVYVGFASFRPIIRRAEVIQTRARPSYLSLSIAFSTGVAILFALTMGITDWYTSNIARASNGVGPSAELTQGDSNLGFNSAVTATRQPAAILRLDADYAQNPNAPMLYLREGALSEFIGREFVKAKDKFDTDISGSGLGEVFVAANQPEGAEYRVEVPQSIYIISTHQAPFAIDQAVRFRPLKNPNPNRFLAAYQALSLAPTRGLREIADNGVGNPNWDEETWAHYLRAPGSQSKPDLPFLSPEGDPGKDSFGEDLRYRQMAERLAGQGDHPLLKAARIIRYLSEESIYTRSPGHDVSEDGDPVAPYLFGEKKRGYCVHFAHAAVYMFRLLGIPARIGTGYQTDTRYAKDGHILLMLGDRHAWPEVYITGRGWTVLDVAPAQAENEPELVPDENLLEDFMSELDPAPEFVESQPSEIKDDQSPLNRKVALYLLLGIVALAVLSIVLFKAFLYYGYRFTSKPGLRAKRAYVAFAARLADCGQERQAGETRLEFTKRLKQETQIDAKSLALYLEQSVYPREPQYHSAETIKHALGEVKKEYAEAIPWHTRALGTMSANSVFRSRWL